MKKMQSKNLDSSHAKKLSVGLGSAILSIVLLSGCAKFDKLPENFKIEHIPVDENIKRESDPDYNLLKVLDATLTNYQIPKSTIVGYLGGCAVIGLFGGLGLTKVLPSKSNKKKVKQKNNFIRSCIFFIS